MQACPILCTFTNERDEIVDKEKEINIKSICVCLCVIADIIPIDMVKNHL